MMRQAFAIALGATMALAAVAEAHGPPRLRTELTVTLDATPAEVWEVVGRFDDMSWHPAVTATQMQPEGAPVDVPEESTRILTLADDPDATITEMLTGLDPEIRRLRYMITQVDPAVLPVTNYASILQVNDVDGKAELVWRAGYYRGFPNNDPPADQNDDAATAAVEAVYQAGIDALVERFGRVD